MKYFTIAELCESHTAMKLHIPNIPHPEHCRNLMMLTDVLLDPIREAWGGPLIVTSGFRCNELNKAVGGAKNSQHLNGQAADLTTLGCNWLKNYQLFEMIKKSDLPFDQLIAEKNAQGNRCGWVHISWSKTPRREVLSFK